jgi:enamine deaminase RidA (YjgF/YER057c/UK114 family)
VAVASGTRTVFLAGQVARTEAGEPVGAGDLAAQVEQAYLNVATALAAVGGSFDDVAKLTVYVVDWSGEKMAALGAGVERAGGRLGGTRSSPSRSSQSQRWASPTSSSRSTPSPYFSSARSQARVAITARTQGSLIGTSEGSQSAAAVA